MLPQEVIARKRDGGSLSAEEIRYMVEGLTAETISEGQVAAFAMAVLFRGIDTRRARGADPGHARQRHACSLGPARARRRQALDRRRRRQRLA